LSKQIWAAPIINNNRQRLIGRCSDILATEGPGSFLYLAASRPLLEVVAAGLLDGERNPGVWGTLPVLLFRGFVRHLLATAIDDDTGLALAPRIPIDRDELPLKRSLISRLMSRLTSDGKLKALGPMAHREGCVNTVAALIGEIQRAAKGPQEFASIIEARARDFYQGANASSSIPRQIDFDRDIALICAAYQESLDRSQWTEDDADQLRALSVLRGEIDGAKVSAPWLSDVKLLVLDGFFDFTPAQGEMLRLLIPAIPDVIVNLNRDDRNAEVFRPYEATIAQLNSIVSFEIVAGTEAASVALSVAPLRERLFNPSPFGDAPEAASGPEANETNITLLECANRQTEIRAIAKRIKRLVLLEGFQLSEIVVVVRELASYTEVIARIFEEESVPCSILPRLHLADVPAARAALRLFDLTINLAREGDNALKASELADVVKSGYFRLSETEINTLRERFYSDSAHLFPAGGFRRGPRETNVGYWDADEIENVIAFVGAELRLEHWLKRARQLTAGLRDPETEKHLASDLDDEPDSEEPGSPSSDEPLKADTRRAQWAEPVDVPLPGSERRPKPARELHPALIAWSALVIERLAQIVAASPREASVGNLRGAIMRLLDQLQFGEQIHGSGAAISDDELPALTLDLRGLEGLRRALSASSRAIISSNEGAASHDDSSRIKLSTFLEETSRCARAESLAIGNGDPNGIRVLEVTDVRGLRFRVMFIAGLIEGGFPLGAARDWVYPHEERERLRQYGLTLEDISPDTLLKEEHYFYQAACRATERLYLSRPAVLDDGSETVPSYYIEELKRAVGASRVTKELIRNDLDGHMLFESTRRSELATSLIRQQERHRHRAQARGNYPQPLIESLLSDSSTNNFVSESARQRIATERQRGGLGFGRFDGVLSDPTLVGRLQTRYDAKHVFSASELSLYGRCPFKFFAEKVLKLEPRGEAALDLTALDAGSLLHEILRRFFDRHRGQRLTDCDRDALRRELRGVADEVFDQHQQVVPPLNPKVWEIDRETRKLLLEQLLEYELTIEEQTRAKDVRPAFFELAFGMSGSDADPASTTQHLELRDADDRTVELRGQIDRVDLAKDGTAIAYDYKLSKGASRADMTEGRALQLHIYLSALEQLFLPASEIAGGGYYTMRGGQDRRYKGLYKASLLEYTGVSNRVASTLSDDDWKEVRDQMQSRIFAFVDGIRDGQFKVEPTDPEHSCPQCDYSAVCRYEKYRIQRKQNASNPRSG